ncbi:hypothetical protein PG991_002985 [Apiospora marii]|uniref:Uncharacterized protein n=1 Tax=Apiospora marii TaxID=335849 RepID=A0ABR1SGY7_9PEZI
MKAESTIVEQGNDTDFDDLPGRVESLRKAIIIESKKDGLRFLSIALVARQAHTDWFYSGQPCDGHKARERKPRVNRISGQRETYAMKHGIFAKMTALMIRETIRDRISQIPVARIAEGTTQENHAASQDISTQKFMVNLLDDLNTTELLDILNTSWYMMKTTRYTYNTFVESRFLRHYEPH